MSKRFALPLLLLASCSASRPPKEGEPIPAEAPVELKAGPSRLRPMQIGLKGMVVSDDPDASAWGAEILRRGGNAVDAAIATAFYMSVSRPHYAALGGGGFLVYCPPPKGGERAPCHALDFRETAPAAATRDMFVRDGKAVSDLSRNGALASGVPGNPAGWLHALEKWGRTPRARILERPRRAASEGVRVSGNTEIAALDRWNSFNEEARRIFGCGAAVASAERKPCVPGTLLKQPDLARVLAGLSERGAPAFYEGAVAAKIAAGIQAAGGILSVADLKAYRARERDPVRGSYRGHEVVSMPPPSSGGALLVQMLHHVDSARRQGALGEAGSTAHQHAVLHAMKLAFADRAEYLGDSDFTAVPLARLTDAKVASARWDASFSPSRATAVEPMSLAEAPREGMHTTHLSAIDSEGGAVAMTVTVNDNFGSGFVPPGTGVVMNNEMDDFAAQPGVPNLFGLVGAEANAVAAGKRPLSSMTPTIVRDSGGSVRLVLGAQGGPRILTAVFQTIVNRLEFGLSLPDAAGAARVHHQWKPDEAYVESPGTAPEILKGLEAMGYVVRKTTGVGRLQAIERFADGRVWGVPDPRTEGGAAAE